ncbi:MAG: ferritin-like domain-containing protein [Candidatus Palauibacterales bacterium]|nr:ferritin-like domain-containing protein [Candidatus Palauibacterales bacterium]
MDRQELIDGLNEQLNREVTTFLRYMLQAASITGAKNEPVREMYLEEVTDEVGHAQYLANQIVALGGTPRLDPDLTPPPSDVATMLEQDAAAEVEDVRHYTRLADLADDEGLMALKMAMEDQAADEDEHREEMKRLQD